eukprot:3741492-Lingulodinium_polyedra.AAC.1
MDVEVLERDVGGGRPRVRITQEHSQALRLGVAVAVDYMRIDVQSAEGEDFVDIMDLLQEMGLRAGREIEAIVRHHLRSLTDAEVQCMVEMHAMMRNNWVC